MAVVNRNLKAVQTCGGSPVGRIHRDRRSSGWIAVEPIGVPGLAVASASYLPARPAEDGFAFSADSEGAAPVGEVQDSAFADNQMVDALERLVRVGVKKSTR